MYIIPNVQHDNKSPSKTLALTLSLQKREASACENLLRGWQSQNLPTQQGYFKFGNSYFVYLVIISNYMAAVLVDVAACGSYPHQ